MQCRWWIDWRRLVATHGSRQSDFGAVFRAPPDCSCLFLSSDVYHFTLNKRGAGFATMSVEAVFQGLTKAIDH
jgi:hypothetical protein